MFKAKRREKARHIACLCGWVRNGFAFARYIIFMASKCFIVFKWKFIKWNLPPHSTFTFLSPSFYSPLTRSNQFYIEFVNLYSIQSPLSTKHTRIQWFIHVGCRSGAPIVFLNFRLDLHDLHWIHDIFINKSELSEWIKLHTQNTHAQIHSANRSTTIFVNWLL